jgi:hypothetical protein
MTAANKRDKARRTYRDALLYSSDSEGEKDVLELVSDSPINSPDSSAMDPSSPEFKRRQKKKRKNLDESPTDDNAKAENDAIPIPGNRLFVGGVPLKLQEKDLTKFFAEFGEVKHAIVHKNKDGTSKVLHSLLSPPSLVSYYVTNSVSLTLT